MFYRIAIVQNEKELFKYDCADWSTHLIDNPLFSFYKCRFFDEHNIESVFHDIEGFDAIFLATNALNSEIIYSSFCEHNEAISAYITSGKGLYVGYSSKIKERSFLPERYSIFQRERSFDSGENEKCGTLIFEKHPAISAHSAIDQSKYISIANSHKTIAGLYFDYIEVGDNAIESYDSIVKDTEKDRTLILCSTRSSGHRLIVSTLPVDWQGQFDVLLNIIKYCTEGTPKAKIVSKTDEEDTFSRDYLFRQLNLNKISFSCCDVKTLDEIDVLNSIETVIIFDSSWFLNDVDIFCESHKDTIFDRNMRLLHYYKYKSSRIPIYKLTVHSAYRQIDDLESSLVLAIEAKTPDQKVKYSYDSSLLATFEAVRFLKENERYTPELYPLIIEQGKKRLLPDGSYDAMFIASCTFLSVWNLCDENCKNDKQYLNLSKYIREEIDSDSHISTYEKAQVLHLLNGLNIVSKTITSNYFHEIFQRIEYAEREELLSYGMSNCWKTIGYYCNNSSLVTLEVKKELPTLINKAFTAFGSFISQPKISVVANYVYAVSRILDAGLIEDNESITHIHKFLFSAIGYLYDQLEYPMWNNDIYTSCLAIEALKAFHALSMYPVDEILSLLQPALAGNTSSSGTTTNITQLLEISETQSQQIIKSKAAIVGHTATIQKLQADLFNTKKELEHQKVETEVKQNEIQNLGKKLKQEAAETKKEKFISIISRLAFLVVLFLICQMGYVFFNNRNAFDEYYKSFNNYMSWVIVCIGSVVSVVEFIRWFKRKK